MNCRGSKAPTRWGNQSAEAECASNTSKERQHSFCQTQAHLPRQLLLIHIRDKIAILRQLTWLRSTLSMTRFLEHCLTSPFCVGVLKLSNF